MADNGLPRFRSVEEARDALLGVIKGGNTTAAMPDRFESSTPSTEHVRAVYAGQHGAILVEEHRREFDRWLAEHDREKMTPMTDTNWDELPWIERATIVTTESLWRDAGTRLTYAAESARNPADTRVSSRTLTHHEGRVQGRYADLGEVSSDGHTVTTRVSTPKVASRWVDEPR